MRNLLFILLLTTPFAASAQSAPDATMEYQGVEVITGYSFCTPAESEESVHENYEKVMAQLAKNCKESMLNAKLRCENSGGVSGHTRWDASPDLPEIFYEARPVWRDNKLQDEGWCCRYSVTCVFYSS